MIKKFYISFILSIEEDNNILAISEEEHTQDVKDKVQDLLYELDDTKITNLKVKEKL